MKTNLRRLRPIPLMLLWVLLSVTASHAAVPIPLRAGPITMVFEPDNAFLRYLKVGPHEVLRGITAPVRDQFWGTVLPVVSKVEVKDQGDHFSLTFEALCQNREVDFLWHGVIQGSAQGEIEYNFDGTARSTFQRNRIGFCVLHSSSAAGKPWVIENIHGEKTKGHFPDLISPHQPAKEIREVAHELAPGLWAHVRMEGDTFEMEDQRNWTDASFKTYCTPLELPYPVRVEEGAKVAQKITIRLEGAVPKPESSTPAAKERTILSLTESQTPLPRLGLHVSSQTQELSVEELKRLKALNLDHLRVDLALTNDYFPRQLRQATVQAKALGVKLQVGLVLGQQPEAALKQLAAEVRSLHPPISVWWIIEAEPALYQLTRRLLNSLDRGATIAAAHEEVNFVTLNRVRPESDMRNLVAYGIIPQIHAFDNASIMETLPIEAETVRSAQKFIGKSPLIITPITLRLQTMAKPPLPGELPSSVDPRQPTLFAAAWTLGSFKYLAEAGVQGATYFETVGWKGIMESAGGTPLPDKFPSQPGELFPVYHVLREIGDFEGGRVQSMNCSDTQVVAGLALRKGKRLRLLVANLTDRPQPVGIQGLGKSVEIRELDVGRKRSSRGNKDGFIQQPSSATAMEVPLILPPYGIIGIDRTGASL